MTFGRKGRNAKDTIVYGGEMSVFIVSPKTINAIVNAAIRRGMSVCGGVNYICNPDALGQLLADMNFDSYEYRYGIRRDEKYTYRYTAEEFTPAEELGSCRCYDYQACEAPGYYESPIPNWLSSLESAIGDPKEIETRYGKLPVDL